MNRAEQAARSVWFIFAIALASRLAIMLALYNSPQLPLSAFWDTGLEMGRVSSALLKTGELRSPFLLDSGPSAVMTPVYPLLIAGIFKALGTKTAPAAWAVMVLQALLSSLTCVAIYWIGKLSFGGSAAAWAAWLWAICPHTQFMPLFRFWENCLSALLAACVFLLLLRTQNETQAVSWFTLGAVTGIAALNNPSLLGFVFVAMAWIGWQRRQRALPWVRPLLLASVALLLAVAPWTVRNYRVFHRVIPVRDNFGLELWVGNHEGGTGRQDLSIHPVVDPAEASKFRDMGETAYVAEKQAEALAYIRAHPSRFLWQTAERMVNFWAGWDAFGLSLSTLPIFALGWWQLIVLFRRRCPDAVIYAAPLLFYPLPYYITHPDIRFRHTIEPVIFVLAGAAAAAIGAHIRERKARARAAAARAFS